MANSTADFSHNATFQKAKATDIRSVQHWRVLWLLNSFRTAFCLLLVMLYLSRLGTPEFSRVLLPSLIPAVSYLIASGLWWITLNKQWPSLLWQARLQLFGDIVALLVIIKVVGGLNSGLGPVILLPVTLAGLILNQREAAFIASIAALGLLAGEFLGQIMLDQLPAYSQIGMLGMLGFVGALGANALGQRVDESAYLVAKQAIELEDLAKLNELVIQNIQNGIVVASPDHRVYLMNSRAADFLKPSHQRHPPLNEISPALHDRLLSWTEGDDEDDPFIATDQTSEILPSFTPLGQAGRLGTLISLEDLSQVKRRMQEIKLAALGRLTASIAHEIRNPLSAISQSSQLLSESADLPEQHRPLIGIIERHTGRINAIIEDIMQLSRQPAAQPRSLDLSQWLPEFIQSYKEEWGPLNGGLNLADFSPAAPKVLMDPGHLRQILTNLISNAFIHAKPSQGPVNVTLAGKIRADERRLYLNIIDNGVGIDEHLATQIFEPFFTTRHEGTGLGLFIARELCEFNGAQLSLRPSSVGSCFCISLPIVHDSHR